MHTYYALHIFLLFYATKSVCLFIVLYWHFSFYNINEIQQELKYQIWVDYFWTTLLIFVYCALKRRRHVYLYLYSLQGSAVTTYYSQLLKNQEWQGWKNGIFDYKKCTFLHTFLMIGISAGGLFFLVVFPPLHCCLILFGAAYWGWIQGVPQILVILII